MDSEETFPIEDLLVMLTALLVIAGSIFFFIRKKQEGKATSSDLLSFGQSKTGTDDD